MQMCDADHLKILAKLACAWRNLPKRAWNPLVGTPIYSQRDGAFISTLDALRELTKSCPSTDELMLQHTRPVTIAEALGRCTFADFVALTDRVEYAEWYSEPRLHNYSGVPAEVLVAFADADAALRKHGGVVLYWQPIDVAVDLTDFDRG